MKSVQWAPEIMVIDSGSTDRTQEIARAAGAKVLQHPWEGYGQQKNWAMAQASQPWVLFLDADEEVSPELKEEILQFLASPGECKGADFPRRTWFLGRWIMHGGWYPNRLVRLVQREGARWTEPPVHEALQANGPLRRMSADLLHYTFRDVGDNVLTNVRFSRLGAKAARKKGERGTLWRILIKPVVKFLETYLWKRGFLDGFPGFVISINAAHSIFLKYVELRREEDPDHR